MKRKLLSLYGLKWDPFTPGVPTEALYCTAAIEKFCWRVEHTTLADGGFAMISGDPGTGKSVALLLLAERLKHLADVKVGVISMPSGRLPDFYREMGDIFNVELSPHNRWRGYKSLRERWLTHMQGTLMRPIILNDEAQEVPAGVLNELRLLSSIEFDSGNLLSVILVGDKRLKEKWRQDELLPLGSRIRARLNMEHASVEELRACLNHLLERAGNASLMTEQLIVTMCEHAMGNYRVLLGMASELLATAVQQELSELDEKLYLQCFGAPQKAAARRKSR